MELAQFDNTPKVASFLDIHMIHPLLDYLRDNGIYNSKAVAKEKIRIFLKTNMMELVQDEINKVSDDPIIQNNPALSKEEIQKRTSEIFAKLDLDAASPGIILCNNYFQSETNLNLDSLTSHGITPVILEEYYQLAKYKFNCGMYVPAEEMLGKYLSTNLPTNNVLGALWGRLACRILKSKWDLALIDFYAVKEAIENRNISPLDQLRQRGWLMHWGLLVFLNQKDGMDALYDFFSEKIYLQTLENSCPWLLRYFTCAAILSSKRPYIIRDVINEIQSISYLYSDPLTQFIEALYEDFDLTSAQELSQKSFQLLHQDYFMKNYSEKFLHQTRLLLCEVYCGINRRVEINTLSSILQLNEMETEKWIAEMISGKSTELTLPTSASNASNNSNTSSGGGLDHLTLIGGAFNSGITNGLRNARIDSEKKQVIIDPPSRAVHQQIIERTKDLNVRCGLLNGNLEGLMNEQSDYIMLQQQFNK